MNSGFYDELRRRGVVRVAALYIIAAWLIIQVADIFFPAWNIPEAALRYLLVAAFLGFPIAIVFGWMYDITNEGIRRTAPAGSDKQASPAALRRADHLTLASLAIAAGLIVYSVAGSIVETAQEEGARRPIVDKPTNSIAVLPFVNISDDPDNEYFCDGISEEILHRLADYRDMHVLARTSSFAFKGSELDAQGLTDILGVKYLLQGSVRKEHDQLRISAQLIDDNSFQVWSETFDRELSGVFAIQAEIAAAVAESLATTISASHADTLRYQPDIDAYQHFLLGREFLRARTPGYQANAIEQFARAIEIDARYAEPHAGRAIALLLSGRDAAHYADRLEEAERSIDAALVLDPELAIGLAAQGLLFSFRDEHVASEQALRKALVLAPDLPAVRSWLGNALISQGKTQEALAEWEKAVERDPLDPVLARNLASRYSRRGDFYRAERQLRRLLELPKPPETAYSGLFFLYDTHGRYVDLIGAGKEWVLAHAVPQSEPQYYFAFLGYAYARIGKFEVADYWLDRAEAAPPVDPATRLRRSYVYRLEGRFDEMEKPIFALLDDQGLDLQRMPPFITQVVGAVRILTGHLREGINYLEPTFDFDAALTLGTTGIDLMQLLAYGHKISGNPERATEILNYIAASLEARQKSGSGRDPGTLALIAQNHAIAGNHDAALDALEIAKASGWRYYYFAKHDERWSALRDHPRYQSLLAEIKADIDAQRARVEQIDAEDDFIVRLDQELNRN